MPLTSHNPRSPNWLKTKVSRWFWSFTPTCKEVARLTSESRDHALPIGIRLRLGLHRAFCPWCARYAKQVDLVHEASHHLPEHLTEIGEPSLNGDACARIKRALRDAAEKTIVAIGGLILSLATPSLACAV